MRFAGRFRWCFFSSWDLQDVSADGFIARGICRAFPLVFFFVMRFAGRFRWCFFSPCDLQEQNHRSGNVPPSWRNKIFAMETFLHAGGTKSSRWKPSSTLEEHNHRDGNLPPRWRNKIIAMETFLHAGGT